MPAKAGIQTWPRVPGLWIPAFAGMTQRSASSSALLPYERRNAVAQRAVSEAHRISLVLFRKRHVIGRADHQRNRATADARGLDRQRRKAADRVTHHLASRDCDRNRFVVQRSGPGAVP